MAKKSPVIREYFKFKQQITVHSFIELIKDNPDIEFEEPHPGQAQVIDAYEQRIAPTEESISMGLTSEYKYNMFVIACGRRWGKSVISSVIGAQELLIPNSRVLIVSFSLDNCEIIFKKIYKMMKALGIKMPVERYRDMELELENGSSIKIASKENVETKLGDSLSLLIIDEARLFDRELLEQILMPMTFDYHPYSKVLLISSPSNGWFEQYYRMGQSTAPEHAKIFSINSPTHVNPTIPRTVLEEMKANMPDHLYRQEVLGEFISADGLVYSEFSKETCVFTDEDFPGWKVYIQPGSATVNSIDPGFSHPFASCWFTYIEELETFLVFGSYSKVGAVTSVHAENIKGFEDGLGLEVAIRYIDAASPQTAVDLQEYDLAYNKCLKPLLETVNCVNSLFKELSPVTGFPKLRIHNSCVELIRQLSNISWKRGQDDLTKERSSAGVKPFSKDAEKKTDWDEQDALRYGIYTFVRQSSGGISVFDFAAALDIEDEMDDTTRAMVRAGWVKL